MNSRLSLCMSSESPGGVHWVLGRVATGAIYHELVLHLTSTFLSWQGNNQKGTFTWRDATFLTWTGLHKDFIMYVCMYICSFTNAHFFFFIPAMCCSCTYIFSTPKPPTPQKKNLVLFIRWQILKGPELGIVRACSQVCSYNM